jgi:hypothetical protein
MSERFLIETVLPIRELSAEARREKAIRHGHISTLHVWWARRPLVTARAAVLGALLTEDSEVDARFIANLCRWEVHDGDPGGRYLLEQARCRIRQRFGEQPPKVLDSFAGGGSIPLEALRLGAEAYAVEYNPVAYLILKATVEYPQRYGHRLISEVKRWGEWVLERAKDELARSTRRCTAKRRLPTSGAAPSAAPTPPAARKSPSSANSGLPAKRIRRSRSNPSPTTPQNRWTSPSWRAKPSTLTPPKAPSRAGTPSASSATPARTTSMSNPKRRQDAWGIAWSPS